MLPQEVIKAVPGGLQQLIEVQLGRLGEEAQQVLEEARVAGAEFAAASVVTGIRERDLETSGRDLRGISTTGGSSLRSAGSRSGRMGMLSGRYGFRHALYQQVLYQRVAEVRRVPWHRG